MGDNQEYKSKWSGEQIDAAVEAIIGDNQNSDSNLLTKNDIVQTTGTRTDKVVSQAFVTHLTSNLPNAGEFAQIESRVAQIEQNYVDKTKISNVYKYQGSVQTYADLPTGDVALGDVYNVIDSYQDYPAGTNFAWDGNAWDALGGIEDLENYYTKAETDSTFLKQRIDDYTGVYEQDGIIMTAGTAPNGSYVQVLRNGDISIAVTDAERHLTLRGVSNEVKLGASTFTINGKPIATLEDTLTPQETQTLINSIFYPATPASYFNFNDGDLTGFSAEGRAKYDAGELTELILPSSYSLGELVTEEVTYTELFDLERYCMENGYNFTFVNSAGETIAVTSEEEFYNNYETLMALWEENQSITVTMQIQKFMDGTDVGVTSLGGSCFQNCTSLTSITIPNSVTSLGTNCFLGCSALTSITIPNSVTSLGGGCFLGCSALISVTIPNSVTSLGNSCFNSCTSLTSIDIPNSVTSLGGSCFQNCTSLTSITIPNSVTSLGNECFYGCSALASITIPNSATSLSDGCFQNCTSLTSITLPNSVTNLGNRCFQDCTSLTSITLPNSVISLGSQCFYRCTSLTSITLPDSVTSLGSICFAYCSALTSITIPNSVTSLGNECFLGCSALTSVTMQSSNCTIGTNVFGETNNCPIYVPAGALEAYKVATNWSTYADRLQAIVD